MTDFKNLNEKIRTFDPRTLYTKHGNLEYSDRTDLLFYGFIRHFNKYLARYSVKKVMGWRGFFGKGTPLSNPDIGNFIRFSEAFAVLRGTKKYGHLNKAELTLKTCELLKIDKPRRPSNLRRITFDTFTRPIYPPSWYWKVKDAESPAEVVEALGFDPSPSNIAAADIDGCFVVPSVVTLDAMTGCEMDDMLDRLREINAVAG